MTNAEKNAEILNTYFTENIAAAIESGDIWSQENITLKADRVIYKNKPVIFYNLQEGTVSSRMEFGNNKDEAAFLRKAVRETRELLLKPEEII